MPGHPLARIDKAVCPGGIDPSELQTSLVASPCQYPLLRPEVSGRGQDRRMDGVTAKKLVIRWGR
jgi:hypothetical protein